jgi:filamin
MRSRKGGLSLAVEGPSKAEISCHDNKDGTISVTYLPTAPGEYRISVKFGDKHIKGSPYNSKVTGNNRFLVFVVIVSNRINLDFEF